MNTNDGFNNDGNGFDWSKAEAELADAEVVDLSAARAGRDGTASTSRDGTDLDDGSDSDDYVDRESVEVARRVLGAPVDPPDGDVPAGVGRRRIKRAIVPAAIRSRSAAVATAKQATRSAGYVAAYHATRSPKYAVKTAWYALRGFFGGIGRLVLWATAEEHNYDLRQHSADTNDAKTWIQLDRQRARQSRWRWTLVLFGTVFALVALSILASDLVPSWVRWLTATVAVVGLARLGRPADKAITDRVTEGKVYRKLTAELVRRALMSLQLAGINQAVAKDPNAISFPTEIHRDGPGHLATVDLPYGVEAADVIARRGRLASGLRLPMDQVWPEPAAGHTGRLALWVGHEPASQMRQPAWPLIRDGRVDVFKPFPFATDPRLVPVMVELMYRNWLFGGQPGSGKTFAMRDLVLAACLDPIVELRGYNLKGTGDFRIVEPVCTEFGDGMDDDTIAACAAMFKWLYPECQRRAKRIEHYAKLGKAPENKVTPELARLKGSGLHPLVVFVDEIQELFLHPTHGKEAAELAEKVIKLGRALGVILLIGTQIPDKNSLPTGITRNVNTRFCLSVADQVANDMILGTSAYKLGYRATVFKPVDDAGWGILAGIGKTGARRSYYVDNDAAEKVMARAIGYRQKAGTLPTPEDREQHAAPAFDVLGDVAYVWPAGEEAVWNETLLDRLIDYRPDTYTGWKSEQLTAALKPHGVAVGQIGRRIDGKPVTRRGPKRDDIDRAIAERNRKRDAS
jgi:S-DNA-T family DNA segregation ATPase FtsK/SpoIIIE